MSLKVSLTRLLGLILVFVLPFVPSSEAVAAYPMTVDSTAFVRTGDSVQVRTQMWLPGRQTVSRKDIFLIQPRLVNGTDSLDLPSVGIYGRTPWLYAVRRGFTFQGSQDVMLRVRKRDRHVEPLPYVRSVSYEPWMEGAEVHVSQMHYTCCGDILNSADWVLVEQQELIIPAHTIYHPYTGTAGGVAHVDFVVNRVELRRDYHQNARELDKISHLIDSLAADPTVRIDTVTLHGYASPEGPYNWNVWLAAHRVKALAKYLGKRHRLPSRIISQRSTPEDWAGLRRDVAQSALPHRQEILRIIDDTLSWPDPDRHLAYIKERYPEDYAVILNDFMPYLRHTDYTIRYTVTAPRPELVPEERIPQLPEESPMADTPPWPMRPLRPLFAVKTNLLLDAALWPNVEVEVPFGKNARWSIMAEWGSPWYVWHHNSRAYEILNVGLELRRWFGKCPDCRPVLSGFFLGLYGAGGKYDLEWNSIGKQGEYASFGVSAGYSWPLRRCLNLEVSGSLGILFGPQRHYHGEFQDTHLIWKHFDGLVYGGPTQLKVSLVWLIPRKWFGLEKIEGRQIW